MYICIFTDTKCGYISMLETMQVEYGLWFYVRDMHVWKEF